MAGTGAPVRLEHLRQSRPTTGINLFHPERREGPLHLAGSVNVPREVHRSFAERTPQDDKGYLLSGLPISQ